MIDDKIISLLSKVEKNILIKCAQKLIFGKTMEKIVRDVQGIKGLHVGYDLIPPKMENKLFFSSLFPDEIYNSYQGRVSKTVGPKNFPDELYEVIDIIRKNLYPGMILPDYCLGLSYAPLTGQFGAHYDSRYRWGEVIVGISLGRGAMMTFLKKGEKPNHVYIPPGSVYIMSGESRYDYKHGILKMTKKRLAEIDSKESSRVWNPLGLRRSLTLRSTKVYSDMMLRDLLSKAKTSEEREEYRKRIRQQNQFKAKNQEGRVIKKGDWEYENSVRNFVNRL